MKRKRRIWLFLDSRNPGGIESHVFQLALGLQQHNQLVTVVFYFDYGHHPLLDTLRENGIPTKCLDGRVLTLWKEMAKARLSVIHTHGYKAGILGRILGKLSAVPVVSTYHAGEPAFGKLGLYCWLDRLSARLADLVLAVSPQIAADLPGNTQLMDNFIDTHKLQLSDRNQIAFVGRLSREKGADQYLLLASKFPNLTFHLYGDGPQAAELRGSAQENIIFHGQQNDMASIWPDIGLLVMPSRHEGLPMAALEAMGRGIPVLACRVGALDQLVDNNINGWLVSPGDMDAMASRLRFWLNLGDEQRENLRIAARKKIEQHFSADVVVPKMINRYLLIAK